MHRYVAVLWHHLRSIVATTPGVSWLAVVRSQRTDKNYFSEEDVRKRSAEMRAYSQPADNGGVRRGGRARAPANRHHEAAKQQQLKRKNPGTGSRLSGKQKQKTGSATNTDNTDDISELRTWHVMRCGNEMPVDDAG